LQHEAYRRWGLDCGRQLSRHVEERGVHSVALIAEALEWLLDDQPILSASVRAAVADYPRRYIPRRRWHETVEAALAGRAPTWRTHARPERETTAQLSLLGWRA
jgi:hypothetical protein